MNNVLIAGGSGLVGSNLIKKLKQKNINIVLLSRSEIHNSLITSYYWNPHKEIFPDLNLTQFDTCINLCGAGIFDKKIDDKRLAVLSDSRTLPIQFLRNQFEKQNAQLNTFVSASAIGIYPSHCLNEIDENSTAGNEWISNLVLKWENATKSMQIVSKNVCTIRIGIVLSNEGGFLERLLPLMKYNLAAVPGNGKQINSWIHIDDVSNIFIHSIENQLNGAYNACSPHAISLQKLTETLAHSMNKKILLPNIPEFALKLIFGTKRAELILSNQLISSNKIQSTGYQFTYPELQAAINNLIQK